MPLFGNSSPFDADVEKATSEMNTTEDWGLIMEVCDRVHRTPHSSKDCLRSIMKRVNHKVPQVSMQGLTLLDACVNNAGREFMLEVASRDFVSECRTIINSKAHQKVIQKLKDIIKSWAEGDFKSDPALDLVPSFYRNLLSVGTTFTSSAAQPAPTPRSASQSVNDKEVDDIAKAIVLSLEEDRKKSNAGTSSGSGIYPSIGNLPASPKFKEQRQVKALYDFEAAEDNELTFKAGEMIQITDDSDQNWWSGTNSRGDGLFPANFVTADLTAEVEGEGSKVKAVQFSNDVQVQLVATSQEPVDIDEDKIDQALAMLQNADPTGDVPDPAEMLVLEEQCRAMGPLIDQELERTDKRHNGLMELNTKVLEALQMYHSLMKQLPGYGYSSVPQAQGLAYPPGQPQMYSEAMPQYQYAPAPVGQPTAMGAVPPGMAPAPAPAEMPAAAPVRYTEAPPTGSEANHVSHNNNLQYDPMSTPAAPDPMYAPLPLGADGYAMMPPPFAPPAAQPIYAPAQPLI